MKTLEMIKELTVNPEKEFKRTRDGLVIRTDEKGYLRWEKGHNWINLGDDWEEAKKPVDFMTAIEALDGGKIIYAIRTDGYREIFNPAGKQTDWGVAVEQSQGYAVDTETILYGKWYIED